MKNPGLTFGGWTGGCSSLLPPDSIAPDEYGWGINIVNRGGIIQTRPGYDCISSVAGTKIQGGVIFTPKNSRPMMLLAIDGSIYSAKFPFSSFSKVDGLQFSDAVPIITFQRCYKSTSLNPDGSLSLIDPYAMVVIQDGVTRAGVFDGTLASHSIEGAPFYGIPIGLWMAWTASRLWVFNKSRAKVSDLANPDTFSETTYIAERSNFELPGDVTGAVETADEKALLVFTESTTTAFKSNIRDRTQWATTPEFQKVILPSIGCVSGRSPVNQYGLTWWFSGAGFINLDAALSSQISSRLVTVDGEMMRSKRVLSPDLSGVCSSSFENFLLCSVPAGGRYNEQTWVADQSPTGQAQGQPSMSWVGVWTGTRPVVWMRTKFAGRDRIYFVSHDITAKDGTNIHVWEAFKGDRKDNGGRISCQMETGMLTLSELQRFRYAEINLCEILGDVELKVFVGGVRGKWHQIKDTTFQAEVGSIGSSIQKTITKESILQAFKTQSRQIKTEEFSSQGRGCSGVESKDTPGLDKGFQLLLEWRGRMGVKSVKFILQPDPSGDTGECKAGEAGSHNIMTESGESIT